MVSQGSQMLGPPNLFRVFHVWSLFPVDALFLSSHERKFLGFKLLKSLLPTLRTSEVSCRGCWWDCAISMGQSSLQVALVLSPNLLHCLVNNASSPDNYLHSAVTHLVSPLPPSLPPSLLSLLPAYPQLSDITSMVSSGEDPSVSVAIFLHLQLR